MRLGKISLASAALAIVLAGPTGLAAETTRVEISRADCQRLVRHSPQADVAYQGGRDVYGRSVAPADLDGGFRVDLPKSYSFELEYQPLERDAFDQTTIGVGRVAVDLATGRATYNGRPMQSAAQAELSARCQRILKTR